MSLFLRHQAMQANCYLFLQIERPDVGGGGLMIKDDLFKNFCFVLYFSCLPFILLNDKARKRRNWHFKNKNVIFIIFFYVHCSCFYPCHQRSQHALKKKLMKMKKVGMNMTIFLLLLKYNKTKICSFKKYYKKWL